MTNDTNRKNSERTKDWRALGDREFLQCLLPAIEEGSTSADPKVSRLAVELLDSALKARLR
jgi:hypothetical protein